MTTGTAVHHDAAGARTLIRAAAIAGLMPLALTFVSLLAGRDGLIGPVAELTGLAFAVVILSGGVVLFLLGQRPSPAPAAFLVRDGVFAVPGNLRWAALVAGQVLIAECLTAGAVTTGARPGLGVITLALPALLIAITVRPAIGAVADRPLVELTPAGVFVRGLVGRYHVPWAELRRPLAPALTLWLVRQGSSSPRWDSRVLMDSLGINSAFLLSAIAYYLDHPDERSSIGTPAGHARLVAALTGAAPTVH